MNPILKKLQHKGQPSLVYNAPPEFQGVVKDMSAVDTAPRGKYGWAIAFVKSMQEAGDVARVVPPCLEEKAVLWLAYPKGTSKR